MRIEEDRIENQTLSDSAAAQKFEICIATNFSDCPGAADILTAQPDEPDEPGGPDGSPFAPGDDFTGIAASCSDPMIPKTPLGRVLLGIVVLGFLALF